MTGTNTPWYLHADPVGAVAFEPSRAVPSAWGGHLPFARWIVEALKPNTFVELGTHSGTSYFAFCQAINECQTSTKAFAVDTWYGDKHAGYYGADIFSSVQDQNREYADFSTLVKATFDEARDSFEAGTIDLLHIDGLHTYDAVRHDFETWLPKMAANGVILFHDVAVREGDFGVHILWNELTKAYRTLTFQHSSGLGVLQLGSQPSLVIPEVADEQALMIEFFERLGAKTGLATEFENKVRELAEIRASLSWRITAPLRWLGSIVRKR